MRLLYVRLQRPREEWATFLALCACVAAAASCKQEPGTTSQPGPSRTVSPAEYIDLPNEEQAKLKRVVIYVPEFFGYAELQPDRGPWASRIDRAVHEAYSDYFLHQLNRTLFELRYPHVRVEWLAFDMWGADLKTLLATSLPSDKSPAMYIARSIPDTMYDKLYADITDLLEDWPAARDHRLTRAAGTYGGRVYCLPGDETQCAAVMYRKDYFAEAGIFNEHGEPGPPSTWTWRDFRKYSKLLTRDTDGDGKTDRWGFCGEQFDLLYVRCQRIPEYVPDKTGKYTWRFNHDDPRWTEALRTIREMRNVDRSVRTGVDFNWAVKAQEFQAGRVAMAYTVSSHPVNHAVRQPSYFGSDKITREVLGMVPLPTDDYGVRVYWPATNMFGFNPTYSREQLRAAIAWFRSWVCGDINANIQQTKRQRNAALGYPDSYPEYLLLRSFESEVPLPAPPEELPFPKEYVRVYEAYRQSELPPTPVQFGLRAPVQLNEMLKTVYTEALFSDKPVERILNDVAKKVNHTCMNFKVPDDRPKLREYYTALLDFARRNMPPPAVDELADFIDTRCKCW